MESSARVEASLLMVLTQLAYASANVLYKLAINDGMSIRVVTAYRHIFGAAFSLSLALIFERKNRPKLTWRVLLISFFCGLFGGSLAQNLYFIGLAWVSATFATSVYILVPAITFFFSVVCGFEKLNLRTAAGSVKVLGPIIGISGKNHNGHIGTSHADSGRKWLGVLCGLGSGFSFSIWLIIQGIVVSGLVVIVTAWCVRLRGPLYASVFNPLSLVIVAVFASLVLDENLYVGSVIGAVLIVCGLYMVLWGKSKEMRTAPHLVSSDNKNFEANAAIVIATMDHDSSDCGNNSPTSSNINIVTMGSR
ncbi:WAT1-related protein [Spatholobus suberectus]|nr:WAT1-related protein [Spatholobus suberectus]